MAEGDLLDFAQQSGNASYNPMSPHPDWGGAIRQTIQMMLGMKQQREQQKQAKEQQMWERAQAEQKMRVDEARQKALEDYQRQLAKPPVEREADRLWQEGGPERWGGKYENAYRFAAQKAKDETSRHNYIPGYKDSLNLTQEEFDAYTEEEREQAFKRHFDITHPVPEKPPKPEKPPAPTEYDKKLANLEAARKAGALSDDEYNAAKKAMMGVPSSGKEPTVQQGAPSRESNSSRIRAWKSEGAIAGDATKAARKYIKDGMEPENENGWRYDMPEKYNWAKMNDNDGVATPQDLDAINKYEALKQAFLSKYVKELPTWKDFLQSPYAKIKEIDRNFIKMLYDIYSGK